MSIHIEINNNTSSPVTAINSFAGKKTATSGKNEGKEWLDVVGYYPTILSLSRSLVCMIF